MELDKSDKGKRSYEIVVFIGSKKIGEKWQNIIFCYKGDEINKSWFLYQYIVVFNCVYGFIFCQQLFMVLVI